MSELMGPEVIVKGRGEARSMPDRAVVQVVVDSEGNTREVAYAEAASAAKRVDEVISNRRSALDRASTAALVVHPTSRWKKGESVRTGWRAIRTSVLEVVDFEQLGDSNLGAWRERRTARDEVADRATEQDRRSTGPARRPRAGRNWAPLAHLTAGRIWERSDIERWARLRDRFWRPRTTKEEMDQLTVTGNEMGVATLRDVYTMARRAGLGRGKRKQ